MPSHTFSVVLPYYNEEDFLERTLRSWLDQRLRPDQLILIDNGSTDGSADLARRVADEAGDIEVLHLHEAQAGKTHALETGCARVTSQFIAFSDADTFYPPHYLETCDRLATQATDDVVSLMALPTQDPRAWSCRCVRRTRVGLSRLFPRQGFVGGYGHVMRADALRRAGGFSTRHWRYVLLDHEVLHRLFRYGHSLYHMELWCMPSDRRRDRRAVRWSLFERALYHAVPFRLHEWYFHRFLGPRFERRRLTQLNLREQPWQAADTVSLR
jgi:glycosyltransferase involved in cell wall biosynthesis